MKSPGGEGNISPEQQMNKLREQARSGGAGGSGRTRVSASEAAPRVAVEKDAAPYVPAAHEEGVALDLAPDANDKDMEELLGILQTRGLPAVFAALDKLGNPHLEDDFHRLLVQYKREGHAIPGLKKGDPIARALDFVLLEVAVPEGEQGVSLSDVATKMEQWYQSVIPFLSLPDPMFLKDWKKYQALYKDIFSMEIAVSENTESAIFYLAVPRARRDIFEKQLFAEFPRARILEKKDDYNIFNQFGYTAVAYGTLFRPAPLPIKTVEKFTYDPLNVLLSAFAKITKDGEGAAVQFVVGNAGEYHMARMKKVIKDLNDGKDPAKTFRDHQYLGNRSLLRRFFPMLVKETGKFVEELGDSKKKDDKPKPSAADQIAPIDTKLKKALTGANIRIVASARTKERAEAILAELESAFGQYENLSEGNLFKFRKPAPGKATQKLIRQYIFRLFENGPVDSWFEALQREFKNDPVRLPLMQKTHAMPLNLSELASLMHFTIVGSTSSREVKKSGGKLVPVPPNLHQKGIVLGKNTYANVATDIHLAPEDRMRHFYTIGQTGTGKTNFLKQMIIQDIENGEGVCFIDPHGVDVQDILSRIPPSRYDDLIYFDPAYTERPMGLNMLEYDPRYPEQKTFVVDELFQIFKKLYGDVPEAFGPIFEQYFRNATLLVLEDPETGSTLLDISRVLSDEEFRHLKLSRSRNPVVNHFWEEIAEQVRGEGDLRNVVPYITSKFDIFIANEIMRPIIGQQRSAFNFKDVMDNKKILLVNLSKGRLGDVNANLIGLIIVGKILMSALGRSEYLSQNPAPFYLFMDEFQNITTPTIATILSEARKYKLSLTMAHQFIKQLTPKISDAVFGNVGSMAVFRVGTDDAKFLESQFAPTFSAGDMLGLDNYNACVKMLAEGKPVSPFSMETYAYRSGDFAQIDALKQISYQRYGKNRDAIEAEIQEKYRGMRGV